MLKIELQYNSIGELLAEITNLIRGEVTVCKEPVCKEPVCKDRESQPAETPVEKEVEKNEVEAEPKKGRGRPRKSKEEPATEVGEVSTVATTAEAVEPVKEEPAMDAGSTEATTDGTDGTQTKDGLSEEEQLLALRAALVAAKDRTSMPEVLALLASFGEDVKRADQVPVDRRAEATVKASELGLL